MKKIVQTFIPIILPFLLLLPAMQSCKKDLCAGVSCLNGGVCVNGSCSCPTGFEGAACEKQKTPSSILIKSFKVTKFPVTTSSGGSWDSFPTSGADIYISIEYPSGVVLWKQDGYFTNVTATDLPLIVSPVTKPVIFDVSNQIVFKLYDNDGSLTPDYVGGVIIGSLYNSTNPFAPTILIGGSSNAVNIELSVEYRF